MKTFLSIIDGIERALQYDQDGNFFQLDGASISASAAVIAPGHFSIVIDGASFDVRVMTNGRDNGTAQYEIQVENEEFTVEVSDPRRWQRGGGAAQVSGNQRIKAPMPGKVVRLLVSEGQAVETGQGLLVVEAMKMQNEIKSPKAGVVSKIATAEGQTVAAGQPVMTIE